jgi:hypothetical protein
VATVTTLLVVPSVYGLVGRFTGSPLQRHKQLEGQLEQSQPAA